MESVMAFTFNNMFLAGASRMMRPGFAAVFQA
jgi:hypothetical protein